MALCVSARMFKLVRPHVHVWCHCLHCWLLSLALSLSAFSASSFEQLTTFIRRQFYSSVEAFSSRDYSNTVLRRLFAVSRQRGEEDRISSVHSRTVTSSFPSFFFSLIPFLKLFDRIRKLEISTSSGANDAVDSSSDRMEIGKERCETLFCRNLIQSRENWVSEWATKHELTKASYYWKTIDNVRFWFSLSFISLSIRSWNEVCTHALTTRRRSLVSALYICIFTSFPHSLTHTRLESFFCPRRSMTPLLRSSLLSVWFGWCRDHC